MPLSGHRPVRHLAPYRDPDAQGALLLDADLVLLRLADHGGVHPFCVPPLDERLDPGHHPLLVHRMTQDEPAGKRYARVLDRPHRHDRGRQVPLRVASPAPVDAAPDPLGPERRVAPSPPHAPPSPRPCAPRRAGSSRACRPPTPPTRSGGLARLLRPGPRSPPVPGNPPRNRAALASLPSGSSGR